MTTTRNVARSLCAAAASMLAACAPIRALMTHTPPRAPIAEAPAAPAPDRPRVADAERVLSYYEFLLGLSPEELAREQERTLRFYGEQPSEFALLQLVVLQMVPNASRAQRTRAHEMLSSYLKDSRDRLSELRPLALLLNSQLTELQKQEAETQTQAARLREELRKTDLYKHKLDALIETERKILERSKSARNP